MKNFIAKMGAALIVLMAVSASYAGTMKDHRDGKTYKTVKIGKQVWMAENLNYQTGESKCYDNKPENCDKYGRLYVWREAVTACPDDWHLPSKEDLEELKKLAGQKAGDIDKAGTVLKSMTGWKDNDGNSGNGIDALGFGALPAGGYSSNFDGFDGEGLTASFWSSTEFSSSRADYLFLYYGSENAVVFSRNKYSAFSVRCVKN